jgi:hypothetical protein
MRIRHAELITKNQNSSWTPYVDGKVFEDVDFLENILYSHQYKNYVALPL